MKTNDPCADGVPSFSKTESPELDNLLSAFRNNVFFPARLTPDHKRLVYRKRHAALLQEDPVTVNIAGELFRLKPIDRTKDLPSHTTGLIKAVSLMKTKQDWNNLIPLLAGWKTSPYKLDSETKERLTRKAGQAGRIDKLVECAKRVDYTGFKLDCPHIVTEMVWYASYNAALSDWQVKETAKALSMVEQISYLLEDSKHAGGYEIADEDPRVRPELIGTLLQLSSVYVTRYQEGKDEDGKVKKYAERLRAVLEAGEKFLVSGTCDKWGEDHVYLYRITPVIQGMQLAAKLLKPGSALAYWVDAQAKVFASAAKSTYEKLMEQAGDERSIRSLDCYKLLLGPKSS